MSNFVYNIKEKHLINGIKLIIDGEKNKIKHSFITTLTYKELKNKMVLQAAGEEITAANAAIIMSPFTRVC